MAKISDDPCYVPPAKRNKFTQELKKKLNESLDLFVTCRGCGRETIITTSNNIGIELRCQVCGSTRFKREVVE